MDRCARPSTAAFQFRPPGKATSMTRTIVPVLVMMITPVILGNEPQHVWPGTESLNTGWLYRSDEDGNWRPVELPRTWNAEGDGHIHNDRVSPAAAGSGSMALMDISRLMWIGIGSSCIGSGARAAGGSASRCRWNRARMAAATTTSWSVSSARSARTIHRWSSPARQSPCGLTWSRLPRRWPVASVGLWKSASSWVSHHGESKWVRWFLCSGVTERSLNGGEAKRTGP